VGVWVGLGGGGGGHSIQWLCNIGSSYMEKEKVQNRR
jgi:hypothetical protein